MWFVLVALVLFVDLYLLVEGATRFGLCPTLAVLFLASAIGAAIARSTGLRMWQRAQEAFARGEPPTSTMLEGLLVLASAALFALPGITSDVLALALLVPPVRRWAAARIRNRLERSLDAGTIRVVSFGGAPHRPPVDERDDRPNIIDVDGVDITPHDDRRRLR